MYDKNAKQRCFYKSFDIDNQMIIFASAVFTKVKKLLAEVSIK